LRDYLCVFDLGNNLVLATMNYFKYLLSNRLYLLLGFFALVAGFVWYSKPDHFELKWVSIACGAILLAFLIGNWIKWRQL
jgi:hypothetical protein